MIGVDRRDEGVHAVFPEPAGEGERGLTGDAPALPGVPTTQASAARPEVTVAWT